MGCYSSNARGGFGDPEAATRGPKGHSQKRLLDMYNVGELLGEGAFGAVYACNPIGNTGSLRAVKIVDSYEIKREADMLSKLEHPNVIKCYEVIHENCFVCMVMDRFTGGELIVGMQTHWKSKGTIPVMSTIHLIAQMASSINYLHKECIIHRDVKCDNFLCDRVDIVDPNCRVVLADFGTAVPCKPTDRLHEKCGTKIYWSPEFYTLEYSLKVDIWAMGVVVYGFLHSKFPFSSEREVRNKQVAVPKGTPQECHTFLSSILEKKEDKRADASKVMADPWIKGAVTQASAGAGEEASVQANSTLNSE